MNVPTSSDAVPATERAPAQAQDGKAAMATAEAGESRVPAAALGKVSDGSRTSRPLPSGEREETPEKLGRRSEGHSYTFFGNTFNETSFACARDGEQRATWASAMRWIERIDCEFCPDGPDPVFDAACQAWADQSIIVLRHQQGAMHRAEQLLHRLAHWATGAEASLRLLGVANDVVLPLGDLAADEAWPADSHETLLLVQRRQDQKTTLFLSSNNGVGVKALRERLRARKSRLLISVAAEWDAGEGELDPFDKSVRTLEVTSATHRTAAQRVDDQESPFDAVPRIVASLFEGLGVAEFKALVDDLRTGIALPATPVAASTSSPAASPPAKLTRHERWLAGHIDQVLGELGVRYVVSAADVGPMSGKTRATGYSLADPASPYAESGWVIAHHPALLAGRADSLLDRYLFDDQASARYRESFLGALARLDAAGVRSVSAEWLMQAWQRAVLRQADPGAISERLYALVEYLSSDSQESEPRLLTSVIKALSGEVIACELRFQLEQGLQPLRTVLVAVANQDAPAETRDFWTLLRETTAAGSAIRELERRQLTSLWALLLLARRWPRVVAVALARVLDETAAPASPWGQAAAELPSLNSVPRYAALALHYLMALAAAEVPKVWRSVAGGIVLACEADVRACLAATANPRAKATAERPCGIQGQRLAFLCLEALAPQLNPDGRERSAIARLELLSMPEDHYAGDASMIGRLLAMAHLEVGEEPRLGVAGAGVLPGADIVRFLRAVALDLQADDEVEASQAADALVRIASGVRAVLPLQHRRGLIGRCRESLAAQQATREEFEANDDIDMVRVMRRRIRATQAVLRCLSAT